MAKQKITIDAAALVAALNNTATARNPEICDSALIEAASGKVRITTTDTQTTIRHTLGYEGDGELVAAARVDDLRAALTGITGPIDFTLDGDTLLVSQARRRFRFMQRPDQPLPGSFPVEEYPHMAPLEFDTEKLRGAISRVVYASARNDVRYYLNGVALTQGQVAATNGLMLSLEMGPSYDEDLILPIRAMPVLLDALAQDCRAYTAAKHEGDAAVEFVLQSDVLEVRTGLVDGKYPTMWEKWPNEAAKCKAGITFGADDLALALKRVRWDAGKYERVDLAYNDGLLRISVPDSSTYEEIDATPVQDGHPTVEPLRASALHLLPILENNKGKRLAWGQNANDSQQLLVAIEGEGYSTNINYFAAVRV